jgi:hypothetical protein
MTSSRRSDFGAALTGLVVGGCVIFAVLFGIVELTHHHYVNKEHAESTK